MRLRNKPWARDAIAQNPDLVIQQPATWKGNWHRCFGRQAPLYIEVGTGKGQFLTGMAKHHPEINFIGIERYESVLVTAMERAKEAELTNLKFLSEDVYDLLDFFADGEVSRLFINFTDPWPKKRHEKRRLTYKDFLAKYEIVLKEKGDIHFKTDNQGLFEYSLHSFSKYGMILHNVSLDLHNSDFEGNIKTEYEEKFAKKGMRIYRCEAQFRTNEESHNL
ncbi:tRNA (guanosine(46)-N7)-methyltransferase TrmB [Halalkalibacterium halodurans]|uniref:tRNA (guanine-N(7)-)-methyltransferase n=1 Tax=Halalkalibacterium halodurans (strain ATCC BAA-125 / DSM 18197 / FERM 7344 / JCM 9153 / C-125) TaxID=272558 RepID=TRMB_HALH5|nr:tRNA (guanosine(46)-N7)-methyltransferase TrmB [Halalkalibacterium halodurans]Q9K7U8.1 RecName: Full=tRNA (guanine-N(7)-)-methyltransferase; AltName: Full=tRNA (guanine(46)-N(7))-methyltransferase; AltName: Full=tRNA(m7G46)-methyltransferase [Halalkalibacterium halodurans C-125]MDY7223793.1 tRNA (guanosine(46)-N7)-methyltransferase TrmB [Halalkalibacterium halodurans]MDY7243014.1 tRNA (guanosine(46)-N7)-methyltransferase TrmB [Halalkalibacterium halodurans]MED4079987.1 tRNA (guanosine(46)-N7